MQENAGIWNDLVTFTLPVHETINKQDSLINQTPFLSKVLYTLILNKVIINQSQYQCNQTNWYKIVIVNMGNY